MHGILRVRQMRSMFYKNDSFNDIISNWDMTNVNITAGMFWGATSFDRELSSWILVYLLICTECSEGLLPLPKISLDGMYQLLLICQKCLGIQILIKIFLAGILRMLQIFMEFNNNLASIQVKLQGF